MALMMNSSSNIWTRDCRDARAKMILQLQHQSNQFLHLVALIQFNKVFDSRQDNSNPFIKSIDQ